MITARGPWSEQDAPRLSLYRDPEGRVMIRDPREAARGPCCVGFRVLLALAWGYPNDPVGDQACHMCCDNPRCMNPAHGRWGSRSHNRTESYIIKAWRHVWREAPASVQALHPGNPARYRLWVQGFPGITRHTPVV